MQQALNDGYYDTSRRGTIWAAAEHRKKGESHYNHFMRSTDIIFSATKHKEEKFKKY